MIWRLPWCCSVTPAGATEKVGQADGRCVPEQALQSPQDADQAKERRRGEPGSTPAVSAAASPPAASGVAAQACSKAGGGASAGGYTLPPVDVILPPGVQTSKGGKPAAAKGGGESATTIEQEMDDNVSVASSHVSHVSLKSTRSVRSSASSVATELINERIGPSHLQEAAKIQQAMKTFARSMVRGKQMGVISPDGALRTCCCSLDKKLKCFRIELKGNVRDIPLADMSEVFQGTEPEDIDTPLDELCSTVMLQSQECISFHFPDVASREHFALCLQVLVDGHH